MTTAHRPTWHAALGGKNAGGNRMAPTTTVRARDLPANLTLKYRKPGQLPSLKRPAGTVGEEAKHLNIKSSVQLNAESGAINLKSEEGFQDPLPHLDPSLLLKGALAALDDIDTGHFEDLDKDDQATRLHKSTKRPIKEESDSEDSDEVELLRELAAIKAEKQQKEDAEAQIQKQQEEMDGFKRSIYHNPLLVDKEAVGLKRKWEDESVFRNQARLDRPEGKRFINDVLRSDFHKKFMHRYIH